MVTVKFLFAVCAPASRVSAVGGVAAATDAVSACTAIATSDAPSASSAKYAARGADRYRTLHGIRLSCNTTVPQQRLNARFAAAEGDE